MANLTKKCMKCNITKPIDQFTKNSYLSENTDLWCKTCRNSNVSSELTLKEYLFENQRPYDEDLFKGCIEESEKKNKSKNIDDYNKILLNATRIYFSKMMLINSCDGGKKLTKNDLKDKPTPKKTTNKQSKSKKNIEPPNEEMIEKWGEGYQPEYYQLFENKYQRLSNTYQLPTESHKEFLRKACVCSVMADIAMAEKNTKDAKEWMAMFKDTTSAGKLQPSQMSKADLSQGMDTFGQLSRMVEEAVDIIKILPKFKKKPKDMVDFNIWCYVNYERDLHGLPLCQYEDIYMFYENRKKDYIESGFIEEEI